MKFNYNGNLTEEKRIIDVANDILNEYPEINKTKAFIIASLEEPITTYNQDLNIEFKRLYNMLFILNNDYNLKDTYNNIQKKINNVYIKIISKESDYNKIYLVNNIMKELNSYFNNERITFPTINEFK